MLRNKIAIVVLLTSAISLAAVKHFVVHTSAQPNMQKIEHGSLTTSAGGTVTLTYSAAYTATPFCGCADVSAVSVQACGVTAISTTTASIKIGAARADTVHYICIGDR